MQIYSSLTEIKELRFIEQVMFKSYCYTILKSGICFNFEHRQDKPFSINLYL